MWALKFLGLVALVFAVFAVAYVTQIREMRARRVADAASRRLCTGVDAFAHPIDTAPLVAPFTGRSVLAYRIDLLLRQGTADDGDADTEHRYSEAAGRAALVRNGQAIGVLELGPDAALFPEPELAEYPLGGITVAIFSTALGATRLPPHLLDFVRARGLGELLEAKFFSSGQRVFFNERIIVPPVFVAGDPVRDSTGAVVYRGAIT